MTEPRIQAAKVSKSAVDDLLGELLAGTLDLAYVARDDTPLPAGTRVLMTHEEELVVVVDTDHPLARYREVLLTDLAAERFVKFQGGAGLQRVVEQLCAEAGLDRRITVRVSELELVLSLVRVGLGIAVVPAGVAERTDLVRLRIVPPTRCARWRWWPGAPAPSTRPRRWPWCTSCTATTSTALERGESSTYGSPDVLVGGLSAGSGGH